MQPAIRRGILAGALCLLTPMGQSGQAQEKPPVAPMAADRLAAIDRISSDSLKGHLSFLASDLLEGRDTPSRGLDLAAEYIAAQYRRAGLEAVGDDGYFQTANWEVIEPDPAGPRLEFLVEGKPVLVDKDRVVVSRVGPIDVPLADTIKLEFRENMDLDVEAVAGKVVLIEAPNPRALEVGLSPFRQVLAKLTTSKAVLVVIISRAGQGSGNPGRPTGGRLVDPQSPRPIRPVPTGTPNVVVTDPKILGLFDAMPVGPGGSKVSMVVAAPVHRPAKLRNVAGLLRGSDPALKETCVMVTAHYDHVGVRGPEGTDRIYNGANDDGSGTVSVIELASALASLKDRPRRSILFVTFFGEEKGLLGSKYYGRHPIFPVEKTVADVNLEQVGRTDDSEGPQTNTAALTGFGYSDVSKVFVAAGEAEGVKVYRHPRNSDAYFGQSDNQALADLGVPAHTLCVAFGFADYHGPADHWEKVDYANMAKIDRVVARALLTIADDPNEPAWDESNPRAARYLKAWKDRRAK